MHASQLGVQSWLVSTSHTSMMAVAMDVAVCSGGHQPERLQKQTGRLNGLAAVHSGPEQPFVHQAECLQISLKQSSLACATRWH